MPRDYKKRGKKHKKHQHDRDLKPYEEVGEEDTEQRAGPSWVVRRNEQENNKVNLDAPFGYVDPDVKAYFKTVDNKLKEWQETSGGVMLDEGGEDNSNEERRLFLMAALNELSGKEKQLATDPDCSVILERMSYSMDDFVKRVLMDRLAGSYGQLCRHRFGSHIVQTLLSVAKGTICRESRGIFPPLPDSNDKSGTLPTLTRLILDLGEELLPSFAALIMDPFASHDLRALFVLLCPNLPSSVDPSLAILRSKKSAKHRARQGPMKSVFTNDLDEENIAKGKGKTAVKYPAEFDVLARKFVEAIRDRQSANEVRALAADKNACPVLALMLEMESSQGTANESGSLMDSISAGLISACLKSPLQRPEASDYVATLLREATSSHLLERLVSLVPQSAFDIIWEQYFAGKLNRLAVHPVANFVVSRAIERIDAPRLGSTLKELQGSWSKILKNARTGVLKSLIDRSVATKASEREICDIIVNIFGPDTDEARKLLVLCVLYLRTFVEYQEAIRLRSVSRESDKEDHPDKKVSGGLEPTIQGSVLVRSLLQLPEPQNILITDSLTSLPPKQLLELAHHPVSSRVLDALLESPSVPARARRRLILAFHGHFPALVDDRIGSHVGERLWCAADPYLREKIARGLFPYETALFGSRYGKFFMRGLNLYLLKRNADEWRAQQVQAKNEERVVNDAARDVTKDSYTNDETVEDSKDGKHTAGKQAKKRKTADKPINEIDELFSSVLGKKQKKGGPADNTSAVSKLHVGIEGKKTSDHMHLDSVLNAIRSAPKDESNKKRRKNKH